ncbi:zf-HC2 domain-containing protein [Kitasatospora sp. LaBMicrA B282]|uniref:zf-HC2 domain-containing protein n=1 Tax=Kitasatospora sp. LaBMicrA B282 TaxID=3420949 RepID=UPI003D0A622B
MTAPRGPWDPTGGPGGPGGPDLPRGPGGPYGPDGPDGADRHLDAGAYVLGLLGAADRARFEEHLAGCPRCLDEVAELGGLEPLLAEFRADAVTGSGAAAGTGPAAGTDPAAGTAVLEDALAGPGPRVLDGLLATVADTRRRTRVRRRWLVAVAAVLVFGGPAVTAAVIEAAPAATTATATAAITRSAGSPTGVHATVGVTPEGWGSAVTLRLAGVTGPRTCDLVAVSTQGERQTVASWTIPADGYGAEPAPQLNTSGSTGFQPGQLDHFEVRDLGDGQLLLTVPMAHQG